ncbi:hypothetical protein MRX96_055318 [Rhipicephalus microplus]
MRAFVAVALLSAASMAYADPSSPTKVDVLAGGSLGSGVSGLNRTWRCPGFIYWSWRSWWFIRVPLGTLIRITCKRIAKCSSRKFQNFRPLAVRHLLELAQYLGVGRPGFSGFHGFAPVGGFYGPSGFGGGFNNGPAFYPGYHGFGDYDNCFGFGGYYDGGFHPYYGFGYGSGLGYGGFGGNYGGPFGGSYGFPGSFGQVGDQRATGFPLPLWRFQQYPWLFCISQFRHSIK